VPFLGDSRIRRTLTPCPPLPSALIPAREPTEAEAALWQLLRNRKLIGAKFRRQVPIGRYVADFYCHERKLIIELDGGVHSDPDQQIHDRSRDTYLLSMGLRILRLSNEESLGDPQQILARIRKALLSR